MESGSGALAGALGSCIARTGRRPTCNWGDEVAHAGPVGLEDGGLFVVREDREPGQGQGRVRG